MRSRTGIMPQLVAELEARVGDVRTLAEARDYERAHAAEDELLRLTLSHIAHRALSGPACQELAEIALQVDDVEYPRWAS